MLLPDIPLIPTLNNENKNQSFVVHWLNNKEFHFTLESEKLLEELCRTRLGSEEGAYDTPDRDVVNGLKEPAEMSIGNRSDTAIASKGIGLAFLQFAILACNII